MKGGCVERFMSASFALAVIGALLKLWILTSSSFSAYLAICFMLLCWFWQRLNPVISSVSMSLRPKRYVDFCQLLEKPRLNPFWVFHFLVHFGCSKSYLTVSVFQYAGLVLDYNTLGLFI